MGAWLAWASRLAELPMSKFYSDSVWTQYTPGYLYWLWIMGKLGWVNPFAIKVPIIIADIVAGALIWKVVNKTSRTWANVLFVVYTLSPVSIFDGAIWGQIDGLLTLLMFGTVYEIVEKKNYHVSAFLAGLALLVKPQAIAIMPILAILVLVRLGIKKLLIYGSILAATVVAGFYPFYPQNPVAGILDLTHKMGVSYSYTSLFAFNLWSVVGMWQSDGMTFMGVTYFSWGTIIMAFVFAALIFRYRKYFENDHEIYLMFALSCFIFFLFPTRVHERYLFPMYAFLLTYAGLKKSKSLMMITAVSAIAYTINLYLPYSYYESVYNPLKNVNLENLIQKKSLLFSALQMAIFAGLWLLPAREYLKESVPVAVGHAKPIEHRGNKEKTKGKKDK